MFVGSMLLKRIKKNFTPWNLFILIILLVAFILRIYRIAELLDFHYDQGRDALVIWDLWHKGKLFLIGPTTGLPGVFLGPFYYYLIAPFYLIGGGNPTIPSIFLSFLVTISLYFVYKTGELLKDKYFGLLVLIIGSFSSFFVFSQRWLSNPTPIYLTSILILYFCLKIFKENKVKSYYWYLIYFLVGISMHFESASAIVYFPILLTFTIWQTYLPTGKEKKISLKTFFISGIILFSTFLPQLIFNFKHDNILFNNILNEVFKMEKNNTPLQRLLTERAILLWEFYSAKLFPNNHTLSLVFSVISIFGLLKMDKKVISFLSLFLIIPFIFYLFYRGNHGFLYDYYLTGFYYILIISFSFGLYGVFNSKLKNILIPIFICLFLYFNLFDIYNRFQVEIFRGVNMHLGNQLAGISWIYDDAGDEKFNIDFYVPPVIPHSYNYLTTWYSNENMDKENRLKLLYTLYEEDPPHPERLEAWLARQNEIGKLIKEERMGGIVVQKRERAIPFYENEKYE